MREFISDIWPNHDSAQEDGHCLAQVNYVDQTSRVEAQLFVAALPTLRLFLHRGSSGRSPTQAMS
jgi:hypothetical protein